MSKTKLQMRADLRFDLKDSGSLWSDNELNRCIERAVADFNRFLPDEKVYEDSLQFTVSDESVTFPKDTDLDGVVADEDLNAVDDGSACGIDGQPDVPRPLTCTITDANKSMTGMTVTVHGTDKDEQSVQETFHWLRGDSTTITGNVYFKNVYMVYVNQIDGAGASDLLDIGWGAYTDVWVYLANSPIKWQSETMVGADDAACTRNTDYYIDYANGRVKAIADGELAAEEVGEVDYKKSQIGIDLSDIPGLIRVQRVEYPVGDIPQNFVQQDTFGKYVVITGSGESGVQEQLAEDKQFRIYYDAVHQAPGEFSPGTIPEFLESTVEAMAAAYALYIYALKQEHQAVTDLTDDTKSVAASLTSANSAHTALGTALTNLKKYLDNNESADAAGILQDITDDAAKLRTAIETALSGTAGVEGMNPYLDQVGKATTGDIALADAVRNSYINTTDYVDGDTEPDILAYLKAGDALLNTVTVGGEGQDVSRAYREYAQTVKDALVGAFENDRSMYLQDATIRTNAAMVYGQEAAQRLSNLRSYIEQAGTYVEIANTFAREAEQRAADIVSYLQQASQYAGSATSCMSLADRFRAEADERRNEVYSIWRDRKQYIGDFVAGATRQMPEYK